jgi:NAD(P)H-dependent nitrite reductase small subunit
MAVPFRKRTGAGVEDESEFFVPVATVDEVPRGAAKAVVVGGYEVAVFHVGDEWYAIESTCPHQGGPLAEGWVFEKTVTCPWHAWCFSLETGRMTMMDMEGVATFAVRIRDGSVEIDPRPRTAAR